MNHYHRQTGVALITALLIVSLATILAVSLLDHLHFDTRRTQNILRLDQASIANNLIISASRQLLYLNGAINDYDTLVEADLFNIAIAQGLEESKPIEGGEAVVSITDLQGCFNLNNVVQQNGQRDNAATVAYANLLRLVLANSNTTNTNTPAPNVNQLVDSLVDWIDSNSAVERNGAEYDYYSGLEVPYRTANAPLTSISELYLIQGYNADIIKSIKDHICLLPASASPTSININTASNEVIQSYGLNASDTAKLVEYREQNTTLESAAFSTKADIDSNIKRLKLDAKDFDLDKFQVDSAYFLVESMVKFDTSIFKFFTIIHRDASTHETTILRQTRGAL